jgi:protein-L-isoaspartate(D-aspartate) O-methyltransferase
MLQLDRSRERMVTFQLAARGIIDARVLAAMRTVPRERFVSAGFAEFAYEDGALPIEEGQTISQPYIVARMIEAADLEDDACVLEIGTGSGYAAAVLSRIVDKVYTMERHATLANAARLRFLELGSSNIEVRVGDGSEGLPSASPFDAILVSAAAPDVPPALKQQLAIGGRLIVPVGEFSSGQSLHQIIRKHESEYEEEDLGGVSFVPLVGEQAWTEDGRRAASNHRPGQSSGLSLAQMLAAEADE